MRVCVSDMPLHRQDGKTALERAKEFNKEVVARFLQERGGKSGYSS